MLRIRLTQRFSVFYLIITIRVGYNGAEDHAIYKYYPIKYCNQRHTSWTLFNFACILKYFYSEGQRCI